jgi:N-acetylmuramoyl-L-alanine amidase
MNQYFYKKEGMCTQKMRRLRWTSVCLLTCLLLSVLCLPVGAAAKSGTVVPVRWSGTSGDNALREKSYLINGVTYVPFRAFAEAVGNCEVRWIGASRTGEATTRGGVTISVRVGDEYVQYGARVFYTAAPVRLIDDRLYVPVRSLAKCFGINVGWNAGTRTVTLTKTGQIPRHDEGFYDSASLYWLSRIISAEAKGEPFRGQIAVGNVVLNRVASRAYPDTIYGVIFDRQYGVQFTPSANGMIYESPTPSAIRAAKACLEGYSLSESILYFFNPSVATSQWIANNCTYAFRIGGHVFYR